MIQQRDSDKERKDRIVRTTILVGGGLFVVAMAYGSGMRAQVKKIQAINEVRKLSDQNYRDAQRKLRLRLAVVEQVEARREVALSLAELDKRNFGTAGEHLQAAARYLQEAQRQNATVPDLSPVNEKLSAIHFVASDNIEPQRNAVLEVAAQMDTALSGFVPAFIDDSAKDDTAHPIVMPTMNDVPLPPGNQIRD